MALGVNIVDRGSAGDLNFRVVDLTCDNSYPSGGYPLTAQALGFGGSGVIYAVQPQGVKNGRLVEWDQANSKIMIRDSSGAAPPRRARSSRARARAGWRRTR